MGGCYILMIVIDLSLSMFSINLFKKNNLNINNILIIISISYKRIIYDYRLCTFYDDNKNYFLNVLTVNYSHFSFDYTIINLKRNKI